jgi:hypothetical protein
MPQRSALGGPLTLADGLLKPANFQRALPTIARHRLVCVRAFKTPDYSFQKYHQQMYFNLRPPVGAIGPNSPRRTMGIWATCNL